MKKNKTFSTRVLAEIAIFAAIGLALDALQGGIFKGVFINGGSIGLAMLPIFIIAYRRGFLPGILCGLVLSLIQMLEGIYIFNGTSFLGAFGPFVQILLDYVLAYTLVGVAGAFSGLYKNEEKMSKKILWIVVGTVIGGLLKYLCHLLSGGLFWLDSSIEFLGINGGSWLYTFVYNGLYCIPNIIICTILMVLIAKFYGQFLNPELAVEEVIEVVGENSEEDNK